MDIPRHELMLAGLAVDRLFSLVAEDGQLAPYFADLEIEQVKRHLRTLLWMVLIDREPDPWRLIGLHRAMRLTGEDFDRFGHYLLSALLDLRVGPTALVRVGGFLTRIRGPMLGRDR